MKCKVCGHRSNTISAMAKHYRSKHPSKMKRHKEKPYYPKIEAIRARKEGMRGHKFCPFCGHQLT